MNPHRGTDYDVTRFIRLHEPADMREVQKEKEKEKDKRSISFVSFVSFVSSERSEQRVCRASEVE